MTETSKKNICFFSSKVIELNGNYYIFVLFNEVAQRRNGATVQRCNGVKAQRHNGKTKRSKPLSP
jgi:hypothetical protein